MDNPRIPPDLLYTDARLEWMLIAFGVICLLLTLDPAISSDGAVRYQAIEAWLGSPGVGGTIQIKYSLVQPALSMPIAWGAKLVGISEMQAVSYFNVLVFLAGSVYLYSLLAKQYSPKVARLCLLMLGCASMLPHHLQWYFSEVFSSMLLAIGVLSTRRRPALAALLFALALANGPALIIPFGLVAAIYLWRTNRWPPAVGVGLAVAIVLMENHLKYGSFVGNPYLADAERGLPTMLPYSGKPGFSYPFFFGALSIIFSFGKGLVFYIPGTLLFFSTPIREKLGGSPLERLLVAVFTILVIAFYAKWWAWYGGGFWGPRFFLFLCFPASLLLALAITHPRPDHRFLALTSGLLLLSIWVGVDGYLFGQAAMEICWGNNFALEMLCWYTPEFSALWHPFVTGDIGGAWDYPRAPFALWQCIVGGYLIIQLCVAHRATRQPGKHA